MSQLPSENQLSWICSTLTLQSEEKGFFQTFAETVTATGGKQWLEVFAKCQIDRDRIECCLTHPKVRDVVQGTLNNVQSMFRSKSAKFSKDKREEAEYHLSKNRLTQAALSANISVARAPFPGVDKTVDEGLTLPLSLWVRSKIMAKINSIESALEDIQLALRHHLPDALKLDAYTLMSECYLKAGDREKAKISWMIVAKMAELAENSEIRSKALTVLENLDQHLATREEIHHPMEPDLYDGESRANPGTSSAVSMKRSKDKGRYMVANCKLPVGATVACEEPYASVLKFEKQNSHCLNCYKRLNRVVPCPTCSGVAYCSIACATEGDDYHKWECPFMELMIGSGMSLSAALSLRMVTQHPIEFFLQLFTAIKENDEHPHLKIYNLETHSKTRETVDFVYRTLMALLQLQMLRTGGYFKEHRSSGFAKLTNAEMTVGCMLLRHLQLTQYNAHEIYESVVKKKTKDEWSLGDAKMNYVGLALYPSSDYYNHGCHPTLARYFVGKKLVLRAERPIERGEEVFENYGPSFMNKPAEDRKKILKARYRFVCDCVACSENWPVLKELNPTTSIFRCRNIECVGKFKYADGQDLCAWTCSTCGETNKLEDQITLGKVFQEDCIKGLQLVEQNKAIEAEMLLTKFIEDRWTLVSLPDYHLTLAMEALRNCWASHANFFII
ncbi:Set and mynd domain containing [Nesidiocoris tenuis]|uniref:Protein-lysine N-methyltransferase SMYD4 n=1 Tax=Nesidiocoris tenuis TaxID=355587 RepID=A0ABN7AK52_9HEMI|nr:Set and mynd domain containing [Nesidiocoris tenuis]